MSHHYNSTYNLKVMLSSLSTTHSHQPLPPRHFYFPLTSLEVTTWQLTVLTSFHVNFILAYLMQKQIKLISRSLINLYTQYLLRPSPKQLRNLGRTHIIMSFMDFLSKLFRQ